MEAIIVLGEPCEFSLLYESYQKRIYTVALNITRDPYLAEDVAQETFIKAYRNISRLKDNDKVGAWLKTIATNTAIDVVRKEKKRLYIPLEETIFTDNDLIFPLLKVNHAMESIIHKEEIHEEIARLSPKLRRVFLLKFHRDMRDEEIAKELGISTSAVKTRLYRARRIVKAHLEEKQSNRENGGKKQVISA